MARDTDITAPDESAVIFGLLLSFTFLRGHLTVGICSVLGPLAVSVGPRNEIRSYHERLLCRSHPSEGLCHYLNSPKISYVYFSLTKWGKAFSQVNDDPLWLTP